jgi:hypothetical protein
MAGLHRWTIGLLLAAVQGTSPAADRDATVLRASVRFDGSAGTVRLRALLGDPGSPGAFDPAGEGASATLGSSVLLDVPAGADVRRGGNGSWRVESRGPGHRRASLSFDPGSGRLDLSARGADLSGLLAAGPGDVALDLRLGREARGGVLRFREVSPRRWTFRGGAGDGHGVAPAGDPVAFEPIGSGPRSGVADFLEAVVTDRDAWEALWGRHASGEPIPDVDFESETVVGVFLGTRPTSGYSVEILSIGSGDGLEVAWRESTPGEDCMVLQVLTSPFVLVRVPVPGARAAFTGAKAAVPCGR